MPSQDELLPLLLRDELLALVDRHQLKPPDRRVKQGIVDTIAKAALPRQW